MSKKKDPNGKKAKYNSGVEKTEWDDFDFEALDNALTGLKESHEAVLRERINAQTEHDAVHSYYNVTCHDLESLDFTIQRKDIQIEEKEKENKAELRIYDEKIKHLRYDHERNLDAAEKMKNELLAKETLNHEAAMIEEEKRFGRTRDELTERKVFHLEEIKQMKIRKQEELERIQSDLSNKLISLKEKCSSHEKGVEEELKVRRRADICEMEDQRNLHLFQLDEQHKNQCNEAEDCCLAIEKENKVKLKQLQDECKRVDKAITDCKEQCKKLDTENDQLSEPLTICLKKVSLYYNFGHALFTIKSECRMIIQVKSFQIKIRDMKKNRASMKNVKARKIILEERLERQMEEYKSLRRKFDSIQKGIEKLRNNEMTSPQNFVTRRILDEISSFETKVEDFENFIKYPQVDINDFQVVSSRVKDSLHKALKQLEL